MNKSIAAITLLGEFLLTGHLLAAGIPEPSLILYGTIRNASQNRERVTAGRMYWQFRRLPDGRPVLAAATVTNVADQFCYVLEVPCETLIAGAALSTNALGLSITSSIFDRSQVSYVGEPYWFTPDPPPVAMRFIDPALARFAMASSDRGRMERVDLLVDIAIVDSDGNGLPDDWEDRYFASVGMDPNGDWDQDGRSNLQEYRAGTDPTDSRSVLEFVGYRVLASGEVELKWPSADGRLYSVLRCDNVMKLVSPDVTGYDLRAQGLEATPPLNFFIDAPTPSGAAFFYRILLQTPQP